MHIIIYLIILVIGIIYYLLFCRKLHSTNNTIRGNNHIIADKIMIVAHPDDELIFGGRELLENNNWKVVCVTNGSLESNNIFSFNTKNYRKNEFINVMNSLNCAYEMWDFEDNYFNANWNENLLKNKLIKLFNEKQYKMIVTHNLIGEYGHIQHKKISQLVYQSYPPNLYMFGYDSNRINPLVDSLNKLLTLYSSQQNAINKHYLYVLHQCIIKIN